MFTRYGFFSVVRDETGANPDGLEIRARSAEHLRRLINRFHDKLACCEILESITRDYRFRIRVEHNTWSAICSELSQEIDYGNFKREVERHWTKQSDYSQKLPQVWKTMRELQ